MTHKDRIEKMLQEFDRGTETLEDCVKALFKILDTTEVSDNDRVFSPVTIGSSRVLETLKLEILLPKMRKLTTKEEEKKGLL